MNERQQKLKSILDRWTTCTITIEQAEDELNALFIKQELERFVSRISPYSGVNVTATVATSENDINPVPVEWKPSNVKYKVEDSGEVTFAEKEFAESFDFKSMADQTGSGFYTWLEWAKKRLGQQDGERIEASDVGDIRHAFADAERLSKQIENEKVVIESVHSMSYQPQSAASKVGSFEVQSDPFDTTWKASFDGEPIREHHKLTLVMEAGKLPVVTIDFNPLLTSKES
jgi:hypothetical protein